MKYGIEDVQSASEIISLQPEKLARYIDACDTYKNKLFETMKLVDIISSVHNTLIELGFTKIYANKLLEMTFRKDAIIGLRDLLGYDVYKEKIKNTNNQYASMVNDPNSFYLQNKGTKNFRKYGSLSLAYTNASPINVLDYIIKDSVHASKYHTENLIKGLIDLYGEENGTMTAKSATGDVIVYSEDIYGGKGVIEKFDKVNFARLEQALWQDIKCSGIPEFLIVEFKELVGYERLEELKRSSAHLHTKRDFLDGLFHYFSRLENKKDFINNWVNDVNFKTLIIEDFVRQLYNEPYITPRLIELTSSDIGSKKFEEKRQKRLQEKGDIHYNKDNIGGQLLRC